MKIKRAKCLYVIYNLEINITKIGITEIPTRRVLDLQNTCGCELKLIHYTLPLLDAEKYEKICHNKLKDYRRFGEWFNISHEQAASIVRDIVSSAPIDNFVNAYKEKKLNVSEIAKLYGVTRQAVSKRLKQYGIYNQIDVEIKQPTIIESHKILKEKEFKVININDYIRIAPNTYADKITNETVIIKYLDGKFRLYETN